MKGYSPNNVSYLNNNIPNPNIPSSDTSSQNINEGFINEIQYQEQSNSSKINKENKLNNTYKKNMSKLKQKISNGANYAEIKIDELRNFLVNLYTKFTQKENIVTDYEAENVSQNNNFAEIQEVSNNLKEESNISYSNNENNLTEDEILYLKDLIKNSKKTALKKQELSADEKLNLINKIINTNIINEIDIEFQKSFNEPLFIKQNDFNNTTLDMEENIKPTTTTPSKDKINLDSPIPSPFDPVRMDEFKEIQEFKENPEEKNDNISSHENIALENNLQTTTIKTTLISS